MRKVRLGVFETNSSATHSCVILTESDYDKWMKNRNTYAVDYTNLRDKKWENAPEKPQKGRLYTKEDILRMYKAIGDELPDKYYTFVEWAGDRGFVDYDLWENSDLNHDVEEFITPSGDKMVVACKYGYDY